MTKEEIKSLQSEMKRRGIYSGEIDGVEGEKTRAAREVYEKLLSSEKAAERDAEAKRRSDALREQELELKRLELKQKGSKQGVENKEAEARIARKEEYDKAAKSGLGIFTETTAGAPSVLAGTLVGREMGKGTNFWMDEAQKRRNEVLRGAAQDRISGLTTREGAREGVRLAGAMPSGSSVARVAGRALPNLGLGAFMAGKGALMLSNEGEDDPFYPKMINRGAGIGMLGAGAGLAEQALRYGFSPGVSPDAQALAVINSNQLRRNNADVPEGPKPGSRAALVAEAKAAGIKNTSRMNMKTLAARLVEANKTPTKLLPSVAGPAIAAALAYGATPNRANAADGGGVTGRDEALTNAAVVGGGSYGISKLAQTIARRAPNFGKAVGAGGQMMMPMIAADAYDPTQEQLNMDRNITARNLPEFLQFGAVGRAREMAEVPEPNPQRTTPSPGNQYYPLSGEMRSAESLSVPPIPDDVQAQIQTLLQQGASPDLIAAYLNHTSAQ